MVSFEKPKAPLYFIECDYIEGPSFVDCDRDRSSRQQVIDDIISGEVENVLTVLEVFEDEGTCRNVTEDIARDVYEEIAASREACPKHLRDFIDFWIGANAADAIEYPSLQVVKGGGKLVEAD